MVCGGCGGEDGKLFGLMAAAAVEVCGGGREVEQQQAPPSTCRAAIAGHG